MHLQVVNFRTTLYLSKLSRFIIIVGDFVAVAGVFGDIVCYTRKASCR